MRSLKIPRLTLNQVISKIRPLTKALAGIGAATFLVGGGVRDCLLGTKMKDVDLEVFGANKPQVLNALAEAGLSYHEVGASFCVFIVKVGELNVDLSLARIETNTGPKHKDLSVKAEPYQTYASAARRRDFTINSMALQLLPNSLKLIDPFRGALDLAKKIIRPTNLNVFAEDPLRIIRAAKFAAKLNYSISPTVKSSYQKHSTELMQLPFERIQNEMHAILNAKYTARGLSFLKSLGLLEKLGLSLTHDYATALASTQNPRLKLILINANSNFDRFAKWFGYYAERKWLANYYEWVKLGNSSGPVGQNYYAFKLSLTNYELMVAVVKRYGWSVQLKRFKLMHLINGHLVLSCTYNSTPKTANSTLIKNVRWAYLVHLIEKVSLGAALRQQLNPNEIDLSKLQLKLSSLVA